MTHVNRFFYGLGPQLDAFGRVRVSNPETLFDSKQIHDNQPLFWDDSEESGSGTTSTYSADAARTRIAVANVTAGKRTRQTFMRFNYQPGKSQLVLLTARMSDSSAGVKGSVGLFDDDNGMFFTNDEGTLKVVCRSNVTGTPVDAEVDSPDWNGDPMDGTGGSGVTLDVTKTQIMFIDIEWLGVGSVRMGFVVDGQFIVAHTFQNANNKDVVYMSTPNLPLRYQIENDGTGAATDLDHICSTVISEGGAHTNGVLHYESTAGTHVNANSDGTIYAIFGIKLKAANIGAWVDLVSVSLAETAGSNNVEWMLYLNPTVADTFTYENLTNSAVMVARGATANTVTNGLCIDGGHFSSGNRGGASGSALENAIHLGAAIDGTVDEIVLCARPIGSSNCDIEGGITWRESP